MRVVTSTYMASLVWSHTALNCSADALRGFPRSVERQPACCLRACLWDQASVFLKFTFDCPSGLPRPIHCQAYPTVTPTDGAMNSIPQTTCTFIQCDHVNCAIFFVVLATGTMNNDAVIGQQCLHNRMITVSVSKRSKMVGRGTG